MEFVWIQRSTQDTASHPNTIVHAPDRDAALQKMRTALDEMVILGIHTNLDFQYQLMNNREFCEGKADTGFIERLLRLD